MLRFIKYYQGKTVNHIIVDSCYCDRCGHNTEDLYYDRKNYEVCEQCLLATLDSKNGTCDCCEDEETVYYEPNSEKWLCKYCYLDEDNDIADKVDIDELMKEWLKDSEY